MTEKECLLDTKTHISKVRDYLFVFVDVLVEKAQRHDESKCVSPELPIFVEYTPKLRAMTYGSNEYKICLKEMNVALEHHYKVNRHHPEHFVGGIRGMSLTDILEMLCDWKAATLRHSDGDMLKSLDINQKRFGYGDEMKQILFNTLKELEAS